MLSNRSFVRSRRRSRKALVAQVLVLTLLVGVCVLGIGAYVHFSSPRSEALSTAQIDLDTENTTEIIVPISDVEVGVALDPSLFRRERRPKQSIIPEYVVDFEQISGMYSRGMLVMGQPLHRDYLTTLQPVNKLTASIPPGHRAVAINVDAISSVEGWAQAGARVDVLWTNNTTGEKTILPVAQNAKVLSANRETESSTNSDPGSKEQAKTDLEKTVPNTVTLLMTTKDSLKTRLASLHGKLSLVLRGTTDSGKAAGWGSMTDGGLWASKANQKEIPRNITRVEVKDSKSGKSESILFENGHRIFD